MSFDPRDPADPYDNPHYAGEPAKRPEAPFPRDPHEYRDPLDPNALVGGQAMQAARSRTTAPAICLIVIGALNLLSAIGCIPMGLICYVLPREMLEAQMNNQNPQQAQQMKQMKWDIKDVVNMEGHVWMAGGVAGFVTGLPILFGGIGMLRLRRYGLAVFGSVLAMISPGGCCFLGMAAGIWAMVALMNDDVRAAFR